MLNTQTQEALNQLNSQFSGKKIVRIEGVEFIATDECRRDINETLDFIQFEFDNGEKLSLALRSRGDTIEDGCELRLGQQTFDMIWQ